MKLLADLTLPENLGKIVFPKSNPDINGALPLLVKVINWLLEIGGAVAVVAVLYSGIMYLTAGDDANKAASAKRNLTWAITGVVFIFIALALVNFIAKSLI